MAALSDKDKVAMLDRAIRELRRFREGPNILVNLLLSPAPITAQSLTFKNWQQNVIEAIKITFGEHSRYVGYFTDIKFSDPYSTLLGDKDGQKKAFSKGLEDTEILLQSMIEAIKGESSERDAGAGKELTSSRPCIFIGHGRSQLWARLQVFLEKELGLETIGYESESRAGESITVVLEQMLAKSNFAVLILTAEDETASGSKRARQNVVHEAGLLQGRLGFNKAILLIEEGLEEFSNVAGLQYIPFSGARIDQTFYELQRVLRREGLIK
jgi:predicted nucleotide-binding protein